MYGRVNRIWVLDRGLVSEQKLAWLRQRGARYVVGTAKEKMKPFEKELVEGTWAEVREGIEVKKARTGQSQDTYVLCRSSERAKKERGIRERFVGRIKEGLKTLQAELKSAKTRRDLGKIQRRMGRLLQRNWRASGAFQIEVKEDRRRRSGIRFTWRRVKAQEKWAAHSEGCYLLRTNVTDQSPEELWRTYMQLTEVEAAFRPSPTEVGYGRRRPDDQERFENPSGVAPGGTPGTGAHLVFVLGLCALEDASNLDGASRSGRRRPNAPGGNGADQGERGDPAHLHRTRREPVLHHSTRSRPTRPDRAVRPDDPGTSRSPHMGARPQDLNGKCSLDF